MALLASRFKDLAHPPGSLFPPVQYLRLRNCLKVLVPDISDRPGRARKILDDLVDNARITIASWVRRLMGYIRISMQFSDVVAADAT